MAEALGVAASIVGMVSHLQSVAMALTEIQRRTRTIAKTEQEYFLRLERSMQRATLLLGTIQMLDVSASSNQEPLRILEPTVREVLQLAEEVVEDLSLSAKRKIVLALRRPRVQKNLEKIEALLARVEQISMVLNVPATRGRHSAFQETLDRIRNDSDRTMATSHSYGIHVVYQPSDEILKEARSSMLNPPETFGVVFIHGLNATSTSTWQGVDKYWPSDLLPLDLPQACVMTYDYDSNLLPSSTLSNNISAERNLVYSIVDWLRKRKSSLPLLFCAHSFGGILLQRAVAYCSRSRNIEKSSREFLSSLKGIIFLGTPHIGSRAVSYRSFLERLAPSPSRPILDSLTQSLESTINDADEFRNFAEDQKLPVSIFYESQPSITPGGPIRIVTPERDFNLNDPFLLNGNHASMCRFQTTQDEGYIKIKKALNSMITTSTKKGDSFQKLSEKGLEKINLLQPLVIEQEWGAGSHTLIRAQQDYSEQSRAFLLRLRQQIPVKAHSSERLSGSCDWVKTTDQFKTWRTNQSFPILAIIGHPGSGRSKFAEFVTDDLKENSKTQSRNTERSRITLSHFCRWTLPPKEQSVTWLYEIVLQLLEAYPALFKEIYRKFDVPPITYSDLEALVLRLIQASSLREVDVVVDGLDECDKEPLGHIWKTILKLGKLGDSPRIRFLLTTTDTTSIPDTLKSKCVELSLDSFPQHRNPQIMAFIENQLTGPPNKHRYSNDFSTDIQNELYLNASLPSEISGELNAQPVQNTPDSRSGTEVRESKSNFIWILAAIDAIEGEKSIGAMKRRLYTLPTTLEGLYDISFQRIPPPDRDFVAKVLHFTKCSFRPLESKALTFALAISDRHKTTSEVWEDQVIDLAGSIGPFTGELLAFDNGFVAFAHRSLSTYLDNTAAGRINKEDETTIHPLPPLDVGKTHYEMATSCLDCLMLDDDLEIEVEMSQTSKLPFISYSEVYWFKHGKNARDFDGKLKKLILSYMDSSKMSGWLQRRREAQPELLLPEPAFFYHILASLDLLEITAEEKHRLSLDSRDTFGRTPFHYALANNASKSIGYLMDSGTDTDVVDNSGWSCLHFAVYSGNLKLVKKFSDQGNLHPSLISLAIERRNWDVFDLLLHKLTQAAQLDDGSWTEWKDDSGRGLIHQAVLSRNKSVVESLVNRKAKLHLTDKDGKTALHLAAKIAETSIAEFLIQSLYPTVEPILDAPDSDGNTAFHLATESGDIEMIRLLAENGADLIHLNKAGQLPLHLAAMYGYEKVVDLLLAMGSPVNTDNSQPSPLHLAAAWGWSAVAKRLVRAGAAIESKDSKGRTPLYLASYNGSRNMAELLLSYGATPTVSDIDGMTPLHVAALKGWEPVVSLLLNAGANIHATEKGRGQTPLHFAAISKNPSDTLVNHLLESGADIQKRDNDGNTALASAKETGNTLIAEFLSKAQSNQDKSTTVLSSESTFSLKSSDSFSSATRMDLIWEAEKREQRQREMVFDQLL